METCSQVGTFTLSLCMTENLFEKSVEMIMLELTSLGLPTLASKVTDRNEHATKLSYFTTVGAHKVL